jgi:pantoate--beta-alanine ligase
MGALHEGHLSLLRRCNAENDISVCSIFVNPTQFTNLEDLEKYPRPIEADIQLLSEQNYCNILFTPSEEEMYPNGTAIKDKFQFNELENVFEGKFRPGHFQGVAHIVHKLLKLVTPQNLYLGQKDFQQCLIVRQMIQQENLPVNLIICPIRREEDGLAMSSRNRLLTEPQRNLSSLIYQCLISIQAQKNQKDFETVKKECNDLLVKKGFEPDYIALADATNLEVLSHYDDNREIIALIAASIGKVRLIDNLLL